MNLASLLLLAALGLAPEPLPLPPPPTTKVNLANQVQGLLNCANAGTYCPLVDTGAANAYVISPSPAPTSYVTGQTWIFQAVNANTGASTLNVSSLGAKNITKQGATALASGDIKATQILIVTYDGTEFQMLSAPSTLGSGLTGTGAANEVGYFTSSTNVGGDSAIQIDPTHHSLCAGFSSCAHGRIQTDSLGILSTTTGETQFGGLEWYNSTPALAWQVGTNPNASSTDHVWGVWDGINSHMTEIFNGNGGAANWGLGSPGSAVDPTQNFFYVKNYQTAPELHIVAGTSVWALNIDGTGAASTTSQLAQFDTSATANPGRVRFHAAYNGTDYYIGVGQQAGQFDIARISDGHAILRADTINGYVEAGDAGLDVSAPMPAYDFSSHHGATGNEVHLNNGTVQVNVFTVGTLPTCNAGAEGTMAAVSDALAPTFLTALTGGGTVHSPAYCNGTAWVAY